MCMRLLLLFFCLFFTKLNAEESCIPKHEYFPMEGKWVPKNDNGDIVLGMYSRMSPDGKYVLRSYSGLGLSQVTLMELISGQSNVVKYYETPFSNEAFPVQGSWRYLVDVGGQHYLLDDIKKNQKKADKQFTGGIRGFYTVASELPGGKTDLHKIRSLSWPSGSDNVGGGDQGVGVLSNQIISAKINNGTGSKVDSSKVFYMCSNLSKSDGNVMSLPMMSPTGIEFAAMPQNPKGSSPTMRIYSFGENNKDCNPVLNLDLAVAKVSFSYPVSETNSLDAVLFYASGNIGGRGNGVSFFERKTKKIFSLDDYDKKVRADSFPGFTADGRILYGAHWEECLNGNCIQKAGYIISDPFQSEDMRLFKEAYPEESKHFKNCITKNDVENNPYKL